MGCSEKAPLRGWHVSKDLAEVRRELWKFLETACAKAPGQDQAFLGGRLEWTERGVEREEVRAGSGWGQVLQGFVGLWEGLGF